MNPQPPVTRMRMAARTSSGKGDAPAEYSPALAGLRHYLETWKACLAETGWTPWLILALAAFLRFFLLGIKPPHFDEGINGWFVDQVLHNGFYRYDPTNYHGPLHFYVLFLSESLLGRNLWALRLPVVLVSIACVWLMLKFEPLVGRNVSRIAALAMAVSPGFVFYALSRLPDAKPAKQKWRYIDLAMVLGVGAAVIVVLYSGFFLNWNGVKGLYQAFKAWTETGAAGHGHEKPWDYWLKLMGPSLEGGRADFLGYELPMLAGLILCVFCQKFKNLHLRYLAIYGVGTLFAYSYVKYKTPWCIISFAWPFLFIFGAAVLLVRPKHLQIAYRAIGVLLCISLGSSIWLNSFRCSSPDEPYAYVQTYNDIFKLTEPLLTLAKRNPANYHLTGHLIRSSTYPLPWMLGDFDRVGYYEGGNMPANLDGDFLLVQQDKIKQVESKLKGKYYTDTVTIRNYQDPSKVYFKAEVFKEFFPGKAPDFAGKLPAAMPTVTPGPG